MATITNISDPATGEKARVIEEQALKVVSDFNDTKVTDFSVKLGYNSADELVRITRVHGSKEYYRIISDNSYVGSSTVVRTKTFGGWNVTV